VGMCDFFFFSSRRRHTRFSRDWSSDVCSSDLGTLHVLDTTKLPLTDASGRIIGLLGVSRDITEREQTRRRQQAAYELGQQLMLRSEERRVGKGGTSGGGR